MTPSGKQYHFHAVLNRFPGKGGFYFVEFPYDVEQEFGTRSAVRVKGSLNNIPIDRALKPRGDGTHYILINAELRRQTGIRVGNEVLVILQRNEEPDEPEIPFEMEEAFLLEPEAKNIFEALIPSLRRGIIYWLCSAKRAETRAQRAGVILQRLSTGYFQATQGKRKD